MHQYITLKVYLWPTERLAYGIQAVKALLRNAGGHGLDAASNPSPGTEWWTSIR